ncbi:hypothetical protein IAR50_004258 [Cryptococcus sp. DSM 104548]
MAIGDDASAERGLSASVITPEQVAAMLQSVEALAKAAMQNMSTTTGQDSSTFTSTHPRQMPYASDKDTQIWKGQSETLETCLIWFECTAKEKGLPKEDYLTQWLEYVHAGIVDRLRITLDDITDWGKAKDRLRAMYPDRAKLVEGTLESLQALAIVWAAKPLQIMEDLTERRNAYAKDVKKFIDDGGSVDSVNRFWFEGLPIDWKIRYRESQWRLGTAVDRKRFPSKKAVENWLEQVLDPTDVLESLVTEKLHPGSKTRQQMATEAEKRKVHHLTKVQEGRSDIITVRADQPTTDYENAHNPIRGDLTKSTPEITKPGTNEVDDLINKMSQLKIHSTTGTLTTQEGAAYRSYYVRLLSLNPFAAQALPTTLEVKPTASIGSLMEKVGNLQMRNRGNYQAMPEYRSTIAMIQAIDPLVAQALQSNESAAVRAQSAQIYRNNGSRDLPPHMTPRDLPPHMTPTDDRKCHFCGGSSHFLRNCPEADKMAKPGAIVLENGFWIWADSKRRIARHKDGTYGSTVQELWQLAKDNMEVANSVNQLAGEIISFEKSMYNDADDDGPMSHI